MLPRESETKEVDLALLSLIFPYRLVDRSTALTIVQKVSERLERERGCIRYEYDHYYNEGNEAEWCFGFPWLGLCYSELGMNDKANEYVEKTLRNIPENWEVPELYIGGKNEANGNTPLAWSVALSYLFLTRVQTFQTAIPSSSL